MKVLTQNYKTGQLELTDVPIPNVKQDHLVVRTTASAVSIGTERAMIDIAQKSLIGKAIARPDWVAQVTNKIRSEGLMEAYRQANGRLNIPVPLGYSSTGFVEKVGDGIDNFSVGDSVVCFGSGYASHAEYILIPKQYCLKKPESISFDEAAFSALGGIALESVRIAKPQIGHHVAVIGLGLLGQITIQILRANGCRVFGADILQDRRELAKELGCDFVFDSSHKEFEAEVSRFSRDRGVDSVIILAATKSDDPLHKAANICKEHGKIVAGGLVGLNVPREIFFKKELNLSVPRAWGPEYDESGADATSQRYRWTGAENIYTFIDLVDRGLVNIKSLISERFDFFEAEKVYEELLNGKVKNNIGIVLNYETKGHVKRKELISDKVGKQRKIEGNHVATAIIGAGQYARGTLLPCIQKTRGASIRWIISEGGLNAQVMAKKYRVDSISSNYMDALNDPDIDLVVILTRHGLHSSMVCDVLNSGKHVFVEKPLALTRAGLEKVVADYKNSKNLHLIVGYNRRFSPLSKWLRHQFSNILEPLSINFRINAGVVAKESWIYDRDEGGGRIIGEICHFIDLLQFFSNSPITEVFSQTFGSVRYHPTDNVIIFAKTESGTIGTINYCSGGDKAYPRESIEIMGGGAVGILDNFRTATFTQNGQLQSYGKSLGVRWGHKELIEESFRRIVSSDASPVKFSEYVNNSLAIFAIQDSIRANQPISIERR